LRFNKLTALEELRLNNMPVPGPIPYSSSQLVKGTFDELTLDGNNFKGAVPLLKIKTQQSYCALNPVNDKLSVKASAPISDACLIFSDPIPAC
jgi:hypothetical protein